MSKRISPYEKQLDELLASLDLSKPKQSLLLHACCGPCSSYVIEYLEKYFDITIFYYNPNIYPESEYNRRLNELKTFLPKFSPAKNIKIIEEKYDATDFFSATNIENEPDLKTEKEKGERCRRCYFFRMKKSYEYAVKNCFDYFTTTLSISPFKDAAKINDIGHQLERNLTNSCLNSAKNFSDEENTESKYKQTLFLPSDFKKKGGFLRSLELSSEYGLYRQDYCGCIFSKINTENERNSKSRN